MADIELIAPTRQKEWTWPASANFILGGSGTGFYLLTCLLMIYGNPNFVFYNSIPYGMIGPVLVGIGFLCLMIEAGRPLRSHYLFRHFRKAWISREALAFIFFAPAVVLDCFSPHLVFKVCAVVSALFFMVAQGFIIYSARAVPVWNLSLMPVFFLSSGFASGAGVALIVGISGSLSLQRCLTILGVTSIILNLGVWLLYIGWSGTTAFHEAKKLLRRPLIMFISLGLGHILPLFLLFSLYIRQPSDVIDKYHYTFAALSGFAILVGVAAQKTAIILGTGFTRGVCLPDK